MIELLKCVGIALPVLTAMMVTVALMMTYPLTARLAGCLLLLTWLVWAARNL
jgi:hypothetical protein